MRHPDREAIERDIMLGLELDDIADAYGISRDAVWRHKRRLPLLPPEARPWADIARAFREGEIRCNRALRASLADAQTSAQIPAIDISERIAGVFQEIPARISNQLAEACQLITDAIGRPGGPRGG